jgi:hypothetical protein
MVTHSDVWFYGHSISAHRASSMLMGLTAYRVAGIGISVSMELPG